MKNYLKLEFVLVIFTRGNLFRQFANATNACQALDGRCSTESQHKCRKRLPMTVIVAFPEVICLRNRLFEYVYACKFYSNISIKGMYN